MILLLHVRIRVRIGSEFTCLYCTTVQQPLFSWQNLQPDSGPNQSFYQFCDALEVKNGASAPAAGWGLDYALQAWGSYWKSTFYTQSAFSPMPSRGLCEF